MKSVFSKAKNVISCLESFMSVTVEMTFPLWLNFSESIEWRWNFRSFLTFWQWIIKVRSQNLWKLVSVCLWNELLVYWTQTSEDLWSPSAWALQINQWSACVTFTTEQSYWDIWGQHKWRRNQTGSLCMCVCAKSCHWRISHQSVSKDKKKKKIKANFVKSSLLIHKFITTWKASDITGVFWDPLLKRNRTDSPNSEPG